MYKGLISLVSLASISLCSADGIQDLYVGKRTGVVSWDGASISPQGHCGLGPPSVAGIPAAYKGVNATTGVSSALYALGVCGMCIKIEFPNSNDSFIAFVNDECITCGPNDLNVGIAGEQNVEVSWKAVSCSVGDNPIQYIFQGSNQYYLKIRPIDSKCIIDNLKVKVGDKYVDGVKTPDYYYTFQAVGDAPFVFPLDVQVTSIVGEKIKDTLTAIVEEPTAGEKKNNFKTCRKADVKNEDPADMVAGKINGNTRRSLRAV